MKKLSLLLLLVGSLASMQVAAFQEFVVRSIRVEGLQRVSKGAVLNDLPIRVGETITEAEATEAIRILYKTGFFKEVNLAREGNTLIVRVIERPTIRTLTIIGVKEKEKVQKLLKQAGLSEGHLYDPTVLLQAQKELERSYFSKGKYGVKVEPRIICQEGSLVDLEVAIYEGDVARICEIKIIGNTVFPEKRLLKELHSQRTNLLSWWTKDDQYAKEKLNADLEILRTYYMDRGYLHFQVNSAQVSLSPDKKNIFITIQITEGDKYTFGTVKLVGHFVVPEEQLICLLTPLKPGDTFSRKVLLDVKECIENRLGDEGYNLAEVNPVPEINESAKRVNIVFHFTPGKRVYVRRISIAGNSTTKDEVLRRELPQMEGTWISTTLVREGREKILRCGFGNPVEVETVPVPGTTDQVDVNYKLEEARMGQIGFGVGWSQAEKFVANFNISQENFFGTGKAVDLAVDTSKAYRNYSVGYQDPYFTIDRVGMGASAYYNETTLSETTDVSKYKTYMLGGELRWVFPIRCKFEALRTSIGFDSRRLGIDPNKVATQIRSFLNQYGSRFQEVVLGVGWSYDSRNQRIFPTNGLFQSLDIVGVVPGANQQYYRMSYEGAYYYPLTCSERWIVSLNGNLGYGNGYGKTPVMPFYRNFFAGGMRFVRGFKENSLGPKDSLGNAFGGNLLVAGTAAFIFPNPIVPDSQCVRTALFFDAGQVYDTHNQPNSGRSPSVVKSLRYSVGVSLTWHIPFLGAPISFYVAQPLNFKQGDERQWWGFQMGTQF